MVIDIARNVIELEASVVRDQLDALDAHFVRSIEILKSVTGRVVITGMGKSGLICRKIAATMASTGTPAMFVHPAEAIHGDLGMIVEGDAVIAVSNSGETEEIVNLLEFIKRIGVPIIAMTANRESTLGRYADVTLELKVTKEACPLGLAPTSSTTATLVMGDAIAMVLLALKDFSPEDFAARHPGGKLGKRLLTVSALMHTGDEIPLIDQEMKLQDVLYIMSSKRLGVAVVTDTDKRLVGVISDGDVRRLLEKHGPDALRRLSADCMTVGPKTIGPDRLGVEALQLMETHKITTLVVTDDTDRVEGVIHLHDLWKTKLF